MAECEQRLLEAGGHDDGLGIALYQRPVKRRARYGRRECRLPVRPRDAEPRVVILSERARQEAPLPAEQPEGLASLSALAESQPFDVGGQLAG